MHCFTGVPLSTQWQSTPYYYPVQIAQFALEHYSKNLTGLHNLDVVIVHFICCNNFFFT